MARQVTAWLAEDGSYHATQTEAYAHERGYNEPREAGSQPSGREVLSLVTNAQVLLILWAAFLISASFHGSGGDEVFLSIMSIVCLGAAIFSPDLRRP
jgi:hypothetical protein